MSSAEPPERAFVAALPPDARGRFADPAPLAAALRSAHQAARAAFPELVVAPAVFAAELARRLGDAASPELLARTRTDHVYLAIAALAADARAVERVETMLRAQVSARALRMHARPDQAEEVRAQVVRLLYLDEPGRASGLGAYAGRGDLGTYLRVIVTRELVRAFDRSRREVGVAEESFLDKLSPTSDPELAYLRDTYRGDVDAAFRAALAGLGDQSRALLRYSVIDGWSVDRIGALYGVHRATAARRVEAARDELGAAIRRELAARLSIPAHEVDSVVRLVQSRVDVSLRRLLSSGATAR